MMKNYNIKLPIMQLKYQSSYYSILNGNFFEMSNLLEAIVK